MLDWLLPAYLADTRIRRLHSPRSTVIYDRSPAVPHVALSVSVLHSSRCTGYRPILDAFKVFAKLEPGAYTEEARFSSSLNSDHKFDNHTALQSTFIG